MRVCNPCVLWASVCMDVLVNELYELNFTFRTLKHTHTHTQTKNTHISTREHGTAYVCWCDFTAGWNSILTISFYVVVIIFMNKKQNNIINPRREKEPKRKQQHEINCIWNLLYEKNNKIFVVVVVVAFGCSFYIGIF